MTWILRWLLEDLQRFLNPRADDLRRLREGMARARHRHAHHTEAAREAEAGARECLKRVRVLEMSPDAPVGALVAARRELMLAEGDVRHHRARTAQAEEALRLMTADRECLTAGEEARHREQYAELLNA